MVRYAFIALIAVGSVVAFARWRTGFFFLILVGVIQDPIRKLTPGAPAYLVLATVPIWLSMIVGAAMENEPLVQSFRISHRQLSVAMGIFIFFMAPAAIRSATYGPGSWKLTLVGLFAYMSTLAGFVLGYAYPKKDEDMDRLLRFYCVLTAVVLVGAPLESMGLFSGWPALGSEALGTEWVRYRSGYTLKMVSGFYRSPDVLGWHSALFVMLCVAFALKSSGGMRLTWILIAGWGLIGGLMCGRRKMFFMLPLFGLALFWLYQRRKGQTKLAAPFGVILAASIVGYAMYQQLGGDPDVERYYLETGDVTQRIAQHGFKSLIGTYRQSGFFGEGLGTATQGTQHLHVARPRTWQEGGLPRLLVELGVPGFIAVMYLAFALLRSVLALTTTYYVPQREFAVIAGLAAAFLANAASFVVSHQIFGDPFVNVLFSFLAGVILSGARYGPAPRHEALAYA